MLDSLGLIEELILFVKNAKVIFWIKKNQLAEKIMNGQASILAIKHLSRVICIGKFN